MKILTQNQNLLASPIELELTSGGKVQPWKDVSFKVVESRPGHVWVESVRLAAGVRIRTTNRLEFDGCSIVDLSIEAVEGEPTVEKLDLVLAVKPEHGYFLTNYRNAPGPGKVINRFVGKTPDHYQSPPMLTTWLGTDTYGLEWSCEDSRGWYLTKPNQAIEVTKTADRVEARFHLIDAALKLNQPRQIRFGLIATPTKPVPSEWRNLRIDMMSYWPPVAGKTTVKGGAIATEKDVEEWDAQYKGADIAAMLLPGDWSGLMCWHPHVTDPKVVEDLKVKNASLRKYGMRGLWNGGWGIAPYAPEWDPWGKEMVSYPITPTFANQFLNSYRSPFVEFMIGSWALNVRDHGMQGIRFDTVVPWSPSENPYFGETWTSDAPGNEGKVYGSQNLFRQREFLKGMRRVFQTYSGGDGGPFFIMGIAGPPIMLVESMEDIREIGEGFYMNAASVKEAYPQDAVRPWMTHKAYGFLEFNNLKGKPLKDINRLGALMVADASPRMSGRKVVQSNGYKSTIHESIPARQIWDAWSWIDRGTSTFHPYWENKKVLKTTGSGEHYASFHLQKGKRILLVVANYEKQPQTVSFEFDLKALGFASATLEGLDAVDRRPVAIENGTLSLEVLPECFRLVKIGLPGEPTGRNLDPKHPEPYGITTP